jgi:hypothetical protein
VAELRKVQPAHYSPNVTVAQAKRAWLVMEKRAPYPDPDAPRGDVRSERLPAVSTETPNPGALPSDNAGAEG